MVGSSSKYSKMLSVLPNYRVGKTIGNGSFAKVKSAVHLPTGQRVAIKILNRVKVKKMGMEEKVQRETKILRLLMHPHIIRQYEVIETSDDIYVVMEYVKSGELFDFIVERGRLLEDEARHFFQQIISGVEYCHRNKIAHRDLKPENVLLDSKKNIKIVDFGLSNVMEDGNFLKTSCGSPNYAAPEVISGKPYSGTEVDIWSCGVILYGLLCGTLPFDDENVPNLFQKIKSGIYTLPDHLSKDAKDLIPRLLMVDPLMRITIPELRQHPWFNNNLPHYLTVPPLDATEQVREINEEIVQRVVKIGFDRDHIIESLVNRIQNQATVAYYLIVDSQKCDPSDYFQPKFKGISNATFDSKIPFQVVAAHGDHQFDALVDNHKAGLRSQINLEKNWSLGLQSEATPAEIMNEIFKALLNLKVCWKKIGPYNMKCRWFPSFVNNKTQKNDVFKDNSSIVEEDECAIISPTGIKFELQLYKVSEDKYLVDIQRIDGPQFLFLHLSDALLTELGVI